MKKKRVTPAPSVKFDQRKNHAGFWGWASEVFGVDVRSLAIFRIALAITVLLDLGFRLADCEAFYSDNGHLPRSMLHLYFDAVSNIEWRGFAWSVNTISGDLTWQYAMFLVGFVAAVALLAGWQTRTATIVVWIIVASMQVRNPLVITSGDMFLKLMLLWSIFLPLGRVWSIDARRRRPVSSTPQIWFVSMASAGFIVQVILMYFFTGVAKLNITWFEGHAMDYVLRLDLFITAFGRMLLDYPLVLKLISWATLLIESVAIWLLLFPTRTPTIRGVLIITFWAFHLGIALCMSIGLFPLICMIGWLPLVPTGFWQSISSWFGAKVAVSSGEPVATRRIGGLALLVEGFCGLLIGLTLWWNLSNCEGTVFARSLPRPLEYMGRMLAMEQHFQMFGIPPNKSPWFIYDTRLMDGTKVDIFRPGGQLDFERPSAIGATFPSHLWRRLHQNLVHPKLAEFRSNLLDVAVRRWNQTHDEAQHVKSATLTCIVESVGPDYNPINRHSATWGKYSDDRKGPGSLFDDLVDRVLGDSSRPY